MPNDIQVATGTVVTFDFVAPLHTVTSDGGVQKIEINAGAADPNAADDMGKAVPVGQQRTFQVTATSGEILYRCGIHPSMKGRIRIAGSGHGDH